MKNIRYRSVLITIVYFLINGIVFWIIDRGYSPLYGSFNILFSLIFSSAFEIENFLLGSSIYLITTMRIVYGFSDLARKKYEIAILIVIILGISLPVLNLSGL